MKKILSLLIMLGSFSAYADPVYWIDVRTAAEFSTGHLEGAVNIPHSEIGNEIGGLTQDKNAEIYVYCQSGGRAGKALSALEKLGYTNVVNEGGYDEVVEKMKKIEPKPSSSMY